MHGAVMLEAPVTRWLCHLCGARDVTRQASPHTRYHRCAFLGLEAPMVRQEERAKVEVVERDDYIGDEVVQLTGSGRPVMAVVTTRDDGQDCTVYAPMARGDAEELA